MPLEPIYNKNFCFNEQKCLLRTLPLGLNNEIILKMVERLFIEVAIHVEGVTLVLPSRLFMLNKYWRILALS